MALKAIRHPLLNSRTALGVVIVIIIIYLLLQSTAAPTIKSNRTVTLPVNSSFNFNLPDNSTVSSIYLASSSNSSATLYISKVPVLERDLFQVTLQKGATVNISAYGGTNADLQIQFLSGGAKSAIISLSYIPKNLNIQPSTLHALNSTPFGKQTTTTISPTTTAGGTKQSSSTTVTTTVKAQNMTQQALIDANSSSEGVLVVNYNHLYTTAAAQCTPSAYNSTYRTKHSHSPSGASSFANVTVAVPTSIYATVKPQSSTLYNITYTAVIPIGNLPALKMQINTTTQFVISYGFVGIFQGETYNTALSQYQALNQSTNPCSPYVP